jgi:hypothetical protein
MSNSWQRFRKGDCPVCQARKDCRGNGDLIFCRGENPSPHYTLIGEDRNGFGMYKLTDLINQEKRGDLEELKAKREAERQKRIKEENEKRFNSLPLAVRDQNLRKIINQLTLTSNHKQSLIARGMSEAHIKERGYVSLKQWQKLSNEVNHKLAGVNITGYGLTNFATGFIVPITNINNQIIGYQIANDDRESAKYIWATSKSTKRPNGSTSHLKEYARHDGSGELPLQVTGNKSGKVILIEGTLKPDVCASLSEDLFIGASGGNFEGSKLQLRETLKTLGQKIVYLALDAGSATNKNVMFQVAKTVRLINSWGYSTQIMDWQQLSDKTKPDYDELLNSQASLVKVSNSPQISLINGMDFIKSHQQRILGEQKIKEPTPQLTQEYYITNSKWDQWIEEYNQENFLDKLKNVSKKLAKSFKSGFGWRTKEFQNQTVNLPDQIIFDGTNPLPYPSDYEGRPAPHIFLKNKRDRLKLYAQLFSKGWANIADSSFMGSGKSHQIGLFENSQGKTWYVDSNHRNVSTDTIQENYIDLQPRHDGLYRDELGHLKVAKTEEQKDNAEVGSNCINAPLFDALRDKGYDCNFDEDNLNPICKQCIFNNKCGFAVGNGYGFRSMRKNTLASNKIRTAIQSLTTDVIGENDIGIFEESGSLLTRTTVLEANIKDINAQFVASEFEGVNVDGIRPLIKALNDILKGKYIPQLPISEPVEHPLYGINPENLINILPSLPKDIQTIINLIETNQLDLHEIFPDSVEKGKNKAMDAVVTEYMRDQSIEQIHRLPQNIIVALLRILAGLDKGTIRVTKQGNERKLRITLEDTTHERLLQKFRSRIFLDATFDKIHTAKILNIDPNSIIEITEHFPYLTNLTIYNTNMEGLSSNQNISDICKSRIEAYASKIQADHPDVAIIGKKSWVGNDGYWFLDNRGTNKFKGTPYLLAVGLPKPNVGAIKDEFNVIYSPDDNILFEDYYESKTRDEVIQLVGRQRVQWFPDQQFILDLVSTGTNLDWLSKYGIKVVNRSAFEVIPDAGSAKQKTRELILSAIARLKATNQKITQENISKISTLSQQLIQKHAKAFYGGWKGLIKKYNSAYINPQYSSSCNFDPSLDHLFRTWLDLDPIEAIKEFVDILKGGGIKFLKELMDMVSADTKYQVLGLLTPIFCPEIKDLIIDSGG